MDSHNPVLVIDVGNTRAKFGLFSVSKLGEVQPLEIAARIIHQTHSLSESLLEWLETTGLDNSIKAVVAGSDPDLRDQLLSHWPLKECQPRVISSYQQIPIELDVDVPSRVGIDRLLNVFAAGRRQGNRQAVIVVDSGTATTVDLMTCDGIFRGGSILPGLRLSAHAMHDYTARLPLLNVDDDAPELPEVPGRNTEMAMRAGLYIGQLGAVRELAARLETSARDRFRDMSVPQIFVTGGGGRQLVTHLRGAIYIDSLPLHGLAMLSQSE